MTPIGKLTTQVRKSLNGLNVKVVSDEYTRSATVTGEIEQLMAARAILSGDSSVRTSQIKTYKHLPNSLYVMWN